MKNAEDSLKFYTEELGFTLEWNHKEQGRAFVFEVSLHGLQLILNQTGPMTEDRAGHGRLFVGLDDEQSEVFHKHVADHGIHVTVIQWGAPTLAIHDLDGNELLFGLPEKQRDRLQV